MIKDINEMSREELIQALTKSQQQVFEAGEKLTKAETELTQLKTEVEELKAEDKNKTQLIKQKNERITILLEIIKLNNLDKYGKSVRKMSLGDNVQLSLFDTDIVGETEEAEEPTIEVKSHARSTKKKEKHIDYSDLPHETIVHEAKDKTCPLCGNEMVIKGYEEYEELEYVPSQVKVVVHKVPKLECQNCVNEEGNGMVTNSKVWKPLFKYSKCSSTLLSAIIDMKFNRGLPCYSIEQMFNEEGINIPRDNMYNWLVMSMKYIDPIFDLMVEDLIRKLVLCADESTTQVLKEKDKNPHSTSYLWQYQTSVEDEQRIVVFEYQDTRSGEVAKEFLKEFSGYLVSDKYGGYNKVDGVEHAYCHAHALREFRKAYDLLPKGKGYGSLEYEAYHKYLKVFDTDNKIKVEAARKSAGDRQAYLKYIQEHRQATLDVFEEFLKWLKEIKDQVIMKPQFTKAINYVLNDEESFKTFVKDPLIPLTNNGAERDFRKWVVNRNRCKFYVSPKSASAAAKIYSLVMTAKENGLNIYGYFDYLFENIRYEDLEDKEALRKYLPYGNDIPDFCKERSSAEIDKRIKELRKELEGDDKPSRT